MESRFTATVVRATGSWYDVLHDGAMLRCRIRGKLRLKGVRSTNPVVVGDEAVCEADGGDCVIVDIVPRRNYVIRRASNLSKESHIIAANVDQALLMVTLLDARHMLVFGKNCLFQDVLDSFGIRNAWEGEMTFWGSTAVGIDRLAAFRDVDVLCFDHGNEREMQTLMATPLWQAMPFVREKRFLRAPAVWFYGATLSAMHFARVLDNALGGQA